MLFPHKRRPKPCGEISCISENRKMRICPLGYIRHFPLFIQPALCGHFQGFLLTCRLFDEQREIHRWILRKPGPILYYASSHSTTFLLLHWRERRGCGGARLVWFLWPVVFIVHFLCVNPFLLLNSHDNYYYFCFTVEETEAQEVQVSKTRSFLVILNVALVPPQSFWDMSLLIGKTLI